MCLPSTSCPNIAVIVGYFNVIDYLEEQIRSITTQKDVRVTIYIFDDCSDQKLTLNYLKSRKLDTKNVFIINRSENIGFAANFITGLSDVPGEFEFYAFSDQDDIWDENKLARAVKHLSANAEFEYSLYSSRTRIVDSRGQKDLGMSPLPRQVPCFENALVQSLAGGNTMVLDQRTRLKIIELSSDVEFVSHDWWCYQLITGIGGKVVFDPKPGLSYRQHNNNQIGANKSLTAKFFRLRSFFKNDFKKWNETNCLALLKVKDSLTESNRTTLLQFCEVRRLRGCRALFAMSRSKVRRHTVIDNIALYLGAFLGKI